MGISLPWTLANERVWNTTHRFAARTFVLGALAGLGLTAVGLDAWLPFIALTAGALIPVAFSLLFYKPLASGGSKAF
jgi:uncharacterized membrane protein